MTIPPHKPPDGKEMIELHQRKAASVLKSPTMEAQPYDESTSRR